MKRLITKVARRLWQLLPMPVRHNVWQGIEIAYKNLSLLVDRPFDWRYGIDTGLIRRHDDDKAKQTKFRDPIRTQSSPYLLLRKLRRYLNLSEDDIVIDLGCGTGRAVFFLAHSAVKQCIGVDFDGSAIDDASRNLQNFRFDGQNVTFLQRDAATYEFGEETIIYLFSPFGIETLRAVMANLAENLRVKPRRIRLCYYSPVYRDYLDTLSWLERTDRIGGFKNETLVYEARSGPTYATRPQIPAGTN